MCLQGLKIRYRGPTQRSKLHGDSISGEESIMCKHSERKEYGGRLYSEQTLLKCQLETHFLLHKGVGNMSTISLDILYYNVGFIYM